MQDILSIEDGKQITLSYPTTTTIDGPPRFKKRHFLIDSVRDLTQEPLTAKEFLRRPLNRRSRFLLNVLDLQIGEKRRIYLGNSAELHSPGILRVALYEPGVPVPQFKLQRRFGESELDRRVLARLLKQWMTWDLDGLEIGVYAEDLKLVS